MDGLLAIAYADDTYMLLDLQPTSNIRTTLGYVEEATKALITFNLVVNTNTVGLAFPFRRIITNRSNVVPGTK